MAGIIEFIVDIDFWIFSLINGLQLPVFLEVILTYWRNSFIWGPLYIFIIAFVFFNFRQKAYWFLLFSMITVGSTDMVSSKLIKQSVERLRPCNTEYLEVISRVNCGRGYSFTSSHATNHFGLATFWIITLGFIKRKYKILLVIWAGLIGFCQVYVGVHFPLDILFGSFVGTAIGYGFARLFEKYYGLVDEVGMGEVE
jgi:membrane-associated phospholipid phosphatase